MGSVSWYRYEGPLDGEHVLGTAPLTVASLAQLVELDEQQPVRYRVCCRMLRELTRDTYS